MVPVIRAATIFAKRVISRSAAKRRKRATKLNLVVDARKRLPDRPVRVVHAFHVDESRFADMIDNLIVHVFNSRPDGTRPVFRSRVRTLNDADRFPITGERGPDHHRGGHHDGDSCEAVCHFISPSSEAAGRAALARSLVG